MAKYLVETISMFRIRYVIEADNASDAMDEVVMNDADGHLREFSQKHLSEIITSTRQITDEEYLAQFDEDNEYLKGWDESQKFKFVNKVD